LPDPHYDFSTNIAIIGAGPAGAGTSLFLSKAGIKHTIFDATTFPRDKVCGDALSGKVVATLNKLDPTLIHEMSAQEDKFLGCWGVSFIAPNSKRLDVPFRRTRKENELAPGYITKRIDFDNFLVDKLNPNFADIHFNTKVSDLEYCENGVKISYQKNGGTGTAFAKMVVGAEGIRSVVNKKFAKHKGDPNHYCSALRAYYENVSGMHDQNFIELYFLKEVLPGYLWVFPLPNNMANVGIGMLSANMKKTNMNLKEAMVHAIENEPLLKDRFKNAKLVGDISGWGLPLGSKKRQLSGDRYLLTGDAASLIDPFSGEGIGNALVSAQIGSEVLVSAIAQNNFSKDFLAQYDTRIYDRLWDELMLSYSMQKWGRIQWLFNMVVNKAIKNKTVRETISSMFEDINLRSKFQNPMFYLRLLFNF
jgi:menaquinone-9 beta-reductase